MSARDVVLGRIRAALDGASKPGDVPREYRRTFGEPDLDLLVERRYLERSQLLQALRFQTWKLLEQLLRWNEGDFKFYSGDEVSFEEGFNPISVEELLIHAVPAPAAPPGCSVSWRTLARRASTSRSTAIPIR